MKFCEAFIRVNREESYRESRSDEDYTEYNCSVQRFVERPSVLPQRYGNFEYQAETTAGRQLDAPEECYQGQRKTEDCECWYERAGPKSHWCEVDREDE